MAEYARGAMTGQQDIETEGMAPEREGAASNSTRGGGIVDEVAPRPVGTGAWPGEPSHQPRGSREAVDENRPADITAVVPNDIPGARYQPRPQDRGNVIVPDDLLGWDTPGEELAEELGDEEPSAQRGAQP